MNYNVALLRNIAICLIVLHHVLLAFLGWPPNHSIDKELPEILKEICGLCSEFGLGVFTFISGYVLYYQHGKNESFGDFIKKKCVRILLPLFFYAYMYAILFPTYMNDFWPAPINGTPLWYLPVLFLCIVITSFHIYTKYPICLISLSTCGLILISHFWLHFSTFSCLYVYLPVFYVGYWMNRLENKYEIGMYEKYVFLLAAIAYLCIKLNFWDSLLAPLKFISVAICMYLIVKFCNVKRMNKYGVLLTKSSFTIYLLHQFIINAFIATGKIQTLPVWGIIVVLFTSIIIVSTVADCLYSKLKTIMNKK